MDKIKVQLSAGHEESSDAYSRLTLNSPSFETFFSINSEGWTYRSSVPVQKNHKNGLIHFYHYYENGSKNTNVDEVVYLDYNVQGKEDDIFKTLPEDIDLRISVKTGLAWKTYKESEAVPATDEQLDVMIAHLKMSIRSLKKNVLRNIIDAET